MPAHTHTKGFVRGARKSKHGDSTGIGKNVIAALVLQRFPMGDIYNGSHRESGEQGDIMYGPHSQTQSK